jgi:hypothetical protein
VKDSQDCAIEVFPARNLPLAHPVADQVAGISSGAEIGDMGAAVGFSEYDSGVSDALAGLSIPASIMLSA